MFILYTRNDISHEDAHRPYDPVSLELSQNTIINPGVIALLEPKRWNTPIKSILTGIILLTGCELGII